MSDLQEAECNGVTKPPQPEPETKPKQCSRCFAKTNTLYSGRCETCSKEDWEHLRKFM